MKRLVVISIVLLAMVYGFSSLSLADQYGIPRFEDENFAEVGAELAASGATEAWARWYGKVGAASHEAVAVVADAAGGVYVTGVSRGLGTLCDIVTIKYATDGSIQWRQTYNGPGKGPDKPIGIVQDKSGNIYVAGWSYGGKTTFSDFVTLKYSAGGLLLWSKRYNSPGNGNDVAHALALDAAGNVMVTGPSKVGGAGGNYDCLTVKYNPAGKLLWAKCYGSPNKGDDYARAITVDAKGNLFVAGASQTGKTKANYDYLTVKYNANGKLLWAKRFDSPNSGRDFPRSIAIDSSRNVIVAGTTFGDASGSDYLTVKYNPAGKLLWAKQYNGPASGPDSMRQMGIDAAGNIYVSGNSGNDASGWDYAIVKYNPSGELIWSTHYNGPGNDSDYVRSMVIDVAGHVYVSGYSWGTSTGYDYATLKYDTDGNILWEKRYNGPQSGSDYAYALAVDASANVYVSGRSIALYDGSDYAYEDFTTVKYDADGNLLWDKHEVAQNRKDQGRAVAVDGEGNIYVGGTTYSKAHQSDFTTLKYGPAGKLLWSRLYNGPGNGLDTLTSLAVDEGGNVLVTGESYSGNNAWAYATLKYDTTGNLLWEKRYARATNASSSPPCPIAVGKTGNVYVTGSNGYDYATLKYDTNGTLLWEKRYDSGSSDFAQAVAVDDAGNVYVAGSSYKSGAGYDFLTLKYDPSGNILGTQRYNGAGNGTDWPSDIRVDAAGNIYVVGYSYGVGTGSDYVTLKYHPDGSLLWEKRYNGPGSGNDYARSLVVDSTGHVYVTGYSDGTNGDDDFATLKYDANGNLLWERRYDGPNSGDEFAYSVVLDADGNVYVTGESSDVRHDIDYATVKYDPDGNLVWVKRSNGIGKSTDLAKAIALDKSGNVYVTGSSDVGILTIKYAQ